MKIHPASQITAWCLMVASLQLMTPGALAAATGLTLMCGFALSRHKFVQLVRRARWIMLSLLLVYAYSTPGQPLSDALGVFSPSREGLSDGALQLARLMAALAGLAILLDRLHRQHLIAGLYTLFVPLRWLGISRERIAVRLALTLHYADVVLLCGRVGGQDTLGSLFEPHGVTGDRGQKTEGRTMELPLSRFALADALLLGGAMSILWLALR